MSQHVVILWLVTLVFSVLHNRSKTPRVVCSGSIVDICVKDNGSFSSLVYRHQASICLYSSYQKSSSSERRRRTEECQQLETFILESHLLHRPSDAEILEKPASLQQQYCSRYYIRIVAMLRSTWRKNAAGENIEDCQQNIPLGFYDKLVLSLPKQLRHFFFLFPSLKDTLMITIEEVPNYAVIYHRDFVTKRCHQTCDECMQQ